MQVDADGFQTAKKQTQVIKKLSESIITGNTFDVLVEEENEHADDDEPGERQGKV